MEMRYDGTLVMPSNYAVIEEEEMTYVDGGGSFQKVAYSTVKYGVNMAVNAVLGGGSIRLVKEVVKKYGKQGLKSAVKKGLQKWVSARVANSLAGSFVSVMNGYLSFSVGAAAAEWLDRRDGCNDNQIYFSRVF